MVSLQRHHRHGAPAATHDGTAGGSLLEYMYHRMTPSQTASVGALIAVLRDGLPSAYASSSGPDAQATPMLR